MNRRRQNLRYIDLCRFAHLRAGELAAWLVYRGCLQQHRGHRLHAALAARAEQVIRRRSRRHPERYGVR